MSMSGCDIRWSSPPPTRGWALCSDAYVVLWSVSPAHAGMGPGACWLRSSLRCLPRPRGDGPHSTSPVPQRFRSPPPTRGWALHTDDAPDLYRVSPAHAGMGPGATASAPTLTRLPRPRGDGPMSAGLPSWRTAAPPPTLGWARVRRHRHRLGHGSPAHAGMGPRNPRPNPQVDRLPRPRGDGPVSSEATMKLPAAPPPTRGWALRVDAAKAAVKGSPAHAGMGPHPQHHDPARQRLPRPRGDGPSTLGFKSYDQGAPPPTRGWAVYLRSVAASVTGSPAHAGMGPPTSW